ncbi:alpha-L-fucosidase [Sediminibacterium soli]|uniref:alpha-L-fucosidase n=1 Tax=Sediminibacterium soli TaxID=2698829 RepID=UPI001379FFB0|nr:alpha-L-fucosidase [Sediminibacterium soli]NCI46639.1 alpha-L-fucosidase [Sediminibacterium soli]
MKNILVIVFSFVWVCSFAQVKPLGPLPTKQQLQWHEKEFYLFVHFGPNTFTEKEWGDGKEDPSAFNPSGLDCAQWVRIARQAGAKGIILTAKHHDGFCLWPSKHSTHTVRESKWMNGKGDVVKALSEACKKAGLEMGIYISPWDRNHPDYGTPAYNDVYIATMKELLTQYGKYFELWWDGANGEGPNGKKQVYDFRRFQDSALKWQPQLVIFSDIGPHIRWCGNERGFIGNTNWNLLDTAGFQRGHGAPPTDTLNRGNVYGKNWIPAEADVSIRPGWFYHASEDSKVKSAEALFNLYLHSVGNGGNLLLNVPPDRSGRFHAADSAALVNFRKLREQAFAKDLLSGAAVHTTDRNKSNLKHITDHRNNTYWAAEAESNAGLSFTLPARQKINAVALEEMISLGQRVISFTIEAEANGVFRKVFEGTTIGRKKIAVFPETETKQLRVTFTGAKAAPVIRGISAYHFGM